MEQFNGGKGCFKATEGCANSVTLEVANSVTLEETRLLDVHRVKQLHFCTYVYIYM